MPGRLIMTLHHRSSAGFRASVPSLYYAHPGKTVQFEARLPAAAGPSIDGRLIVLDRPPLFCGKASFRPAVISQAAAVLAQKRHFERGVDAPCYDCRC